MLVVFLMEKEMDMGQIFFQVVKNILDIGRMVEEMEKVLIIGPTEINMKEILKMIKKMGKVFLLSKVVTFKKVCGEMIYTNIM